MRIKKGDTVKIICGNERGKTSEVLMVLPNKNKIVVKDVNVVKKHIKAGKGTPHGGIVDKTLPISISNVQLVCLSCSKPTRVSKTANGKQHNRICTKCKKLIK